MRRDRTERPRRGGRERDAGSAEEDGNVQHRMPQKLQQLLEAGLVTQAEFDEKGDHYRLDMTMP